MSDPTAAFDEALRDHLRASMATLAAAVEGLTVDQLDATLGPETNPLAVLVAHTVGTARSIAHDLADDPIRVERGAAFQVSGQSGDELRGLIDEWSAEMDGLLDRAFAVAPDRPVQRYRLASQAWWLLQLAGHTREHAAQADLTRQIVLAREAPPDASS
jgi:hypothetical protein